MRKKSASGVLALREAYLLAGKIVWLMAESKNAHARWLAIRYEPYAMGPFLRTRDERRTVGTTFLRILLVIPLPACYVT
jgi:hypothetical protein